MQVVCNFHQGRLHVGAHLAQAACRLHGQGQVCSCARAASSLFIGNVALGLLALEFALRTRAGGGFRAAPVALSLFAQRSAVGLRRDARCPAFGRSANRLTLGALVLLAHVLRAANRALGLFAVHRALRARRLLALHLTLGAGAHWVALGRADGVVALPAALRVALCLHLRRHRRRHAQQNQQQNSLHIALFVGAPPQM